MHDKSYKPHVELHKFSIRMLFIIVACLLLYSYIKNCIVDYIIVVKQIKKLENRLEELKKEYEILKHQHYLLQKDTATIEYYIRKELGYIKPGEKIYVFNTKK